MDALAYLQQITDTSCISCAGSSTFQMPSMCPELNHQCENFFPGGVWGHLTECRKCCTYLSQEPHRASFWSANCQGSSHFALSAAGAPQGFVNALRLPAQPHSRSAAYGLTPEQQDDVFHRSYRYRMPYHTMKELYLDDQENYAQHVMTARARHMDGSHVREVQRQEQGMEEMRRIADPFQGGAVLAKSVDRAYLTADAEPSLFPLTDTRFEPSAGRIPSFRLPGGARPLPGAPMAWPWRRSAPNASEAGRLKPAKPSQSPSPSPWLGSGSVTVDGSPVSVEHTSRCTSLASGEQHTFRVCGGAVTLTAYPSSGSCQDLIDPPVLQARATPPPFCGPRPGPRHEDLSFATSSPRARRRRSRDLAIMTSP